MKAEIPQEYRAHLAQHDLLEEGAGEETLITLRGVLVGGLMCAVIAVAAPYGRHIIQGTALALTSATPIAFFLLFVLLLSIHLLLGWLRRDWAFKRGELITIFIMMMVASAIPTKGVVGMVLPIITGTFYYASPENGWAEQIHPHLPRWFLVDDVEAVREFYEGMGADAAIPWASWLPALLAWLAFYAAFYLALICISVIVRRQWVERERLTYPLARIPLAMIDGEGDSGLLKPFFKKWIMWLGFAISFVLSSSTALHHYFPEVAALTLTTNMRLFDVGNALVLKVNFLMLGLAYFINASVSLSLWLFYLLVYCQQGVFSILGVQDSADLGHWTRAITGHQMMGAIIVLVGATLWMGRDHFKEVARKAWRRDADVDDSGEIMSYRTAVGGSVVGIAGMWVWLWQTGMPAWAAPVFLFAGLAIFIGLARIIAETGLPIIKATMIPAGFVLSSVGSSALGVKGVIATGYTMVWCGDLLVFMMAPLANGLRLSGEIKGKRRLLLWAIIAAMVIALVLSIWFTLYLAYRHGSVNMYIAENYANEPSRLAAVHLDSPTGPSPSGYLWMGSGALTMGLLMVARHKLLWWPFHPLGFVVSFGRVMEGIWFTILLAWLAKALIMRFGGANIYRRMQPFFLGIALGHISAGGVWLVIDGFTGTVGNRILLY